MKTINEWEINSNQKNIKQCVYIGIRLTKHQLCFEVLLES